MFSIKDLSSIEIAYLLTILICFVFILCRLIKSSRWTDKIKKIVLLSRMRSVLKEVTQKYSAEAVISGVVSCNYNQINFRVCFVALNKDRLYIIDKTNLDNYYILPLSSIKRCVFSKSNSGRKCRGRKEYVKSFIELTFLFKKESMQDFVIHFYSSVENDDDFNIISVKRGDFFKLIGERVPSEEKFLSLKISQFHRFGKLLASLGIRLRK